MSTDRLGLLALIKANNTRSASYLSGLLPGAFSRGQLREVEPRQKLVVSLNAGGTIRVLNYKSCWKLRDRVWKRKDLRGNGVP